jgi:hypothetical protein
VGDFETALQGAEESSVKYHPLLTKFLTSALMHYLIMVEEEEQLQVQVVVALNLYLICLKENKEDLDKTFLVKE